MSRSTAGAILAADGLSKEYRNRRGAPAVRALNEVSVQIMPGATLAFVGRSGSGKSTLARCMAGLETPSAGEMRFRGVAIHQHGSKERKLFHRCVQMIVQDSVLALNPRWPALEIVTEPLVVQSGGSAQRHRAAAVELLERVGLCADVLSHRPHQFSGGQRQRLAIARALTLRPEVLILDEAFTGLDLQVRVQLVDLLEELRQAYRLTLIVISHDLQLAAYLSDEIAVLHNGSLVDRRRTRELISSDCEQTHALFRACPALHAPAEIEVV